MSEIKYVFCEYELLNQGADSAALIEKLKKADAKICILFNQNIYDFRAVHNIEGKILGRTLSKIEHDNIRKNNSKTFSFADKMFYKSKQTDDYWYYLSSTFNHVSPKEKIYLTNKADFQKYASEAGGFKNSIFDQSAIKIAEQLKL